VTCAPLCVQAQWISFTDETAGRLALQAFVDAPTANPLLDAQEKDIATADLNRDQRADLIVVRKEPFSTPGARQAVLLMNEGGVLVDRTLALAPGFIAVAMDARDAFIGDFDGDAWEDVVIANTFGQAPRFYRNAGTDATGNWLGLVDETSRLPVLGVPGDVSTVQFCAVWGGDLTGDGALDLYFSNYQTSGPTTDVLLINDGTGHFLNESAARLGGYATVAFGSGVELHDVDADGDVDVIKMSTLYAAPPFGVGVHTLFNNGNGYFDTRPFQSLPSTLPYMFAAGDLNDDGRLDVYIQGDEQDNILLAQGGPPDGPVDYVNEVLQASPRTALFGGNTRLADVDGDGDLDAGIAPIDVDIRNCGTSEDFALLRNDGSGMLSDPWPAEDDQNFHLDPHDFAFLDVDDDGCQDLFLGLCTGWRVFVQDACAATFPAPFDTCVAKVGTLSDPDPALLEGADDDRMAIVAASNPELTAWVTTTYLGATSPRGQRISAIELDLEASSTAPVLAQVLVRDFSQATWRSLGWWQLRPADARRLFSSATGAAALVRSDGAILVRIDTTRPLTRDGSYQVGLDLAKLTLLP
jgi:hypothetical protein